VYISPWAGFELTTLVVIGTDCTCSCKSNYHMITTTTASQVIKVINKYSQNFTPTQGNPSVVHQQFMFSLKNGYFSNSKCYKLVLPSLASNQQKRWCVTERLVSFWRNHIRGKYRPITVRSTFWWRQTTAFIDLKFWFFPFNLC